MTGSKTLAVIAIVIIVVIAGFAGAFVLLNDQNDNTSGTITVMDDRGQNVTFESNPQRIVSLGSSFTEVLFTIGADNQVVGVDKYSDYPIAALNKTNVGSGYSLNAEAVMALEPDCVVIWSYCTDSITTLEGLEVPVLAFYPGSIDDVISVIESLGEVTGKTSEASNLVSGMEQIVTDVQSTVSTIEPEERPKVYFELRSGKSVGPGTLTNEVIEMAGGINIYGNATSTYPQPSSEYIVAEDPDIIVIEDQSTKTNGDIANQDGWDQITAVKQDNIFRINGELLSSSPRIVEGLSTFANWFHPGTESTITIMDWRGENVTLPRYPQRIVSLGSSFTEVLFSIGAGDQVVGVDMYSDYPVAALEKVNVGSGYTLNQEAVMALDPDCVICWGYATSTIETLEGLGVPTLVYYPSSLDDVMWTINSIGNATGKKTAAQELVGGMQQVISTISDALQNLTEEEKPKVYFELKSGKSVGPGTLTNELIEMAGGINIYGNATSTYPQPSSEFIIAENPDIIVIEDQSPKTNGDISSQEGWDTVNAVIDNLIYRLNKDLNSCTPRVIDALQTMAHWFHPGLL